MSASMSSNDSLTDSTDPASGDVAVGEVAARAAAAVGAPPRPDASFQWEDPLLLEQELSEEEQMIRDAAAAFANDVLMPRVERDYLEERHDKAIFRQMGEAGLLGITVDERFGCAGANYVSYGLVAREIERVDSGYRSMMSVQSSLVMYPIDAYGTEAQREKFLPRLGSGELVG